MPDTYFRGREQEDEGEDVNPEVAKFEDVLHKRLREYRAYNIGRYGMCITISLPVIPS